MGLFLLMYVVLGATLAGSFIVAALTMGLDTTQPILYAAIAGFIAGLPVAWVVAKKIKENM